MFILEFSLFLHTKRIYLIMALVVAMVVVAVVAEGGVLAAAPINRGAKRRGHPPLRQDVSSMRHQRALPQRIIVYAASVYVSHIQSQFVIHAA